MTNRIRRVHRTVAKPLDPKTRRSLLHDLQLIANSQDQIAFLQKVVAEKSLALLEGMQKAKLERLEDADSFAEITQSAGKGQNNIDPKVLHDKFKALKKEKDFYACVTVGITKVKDFMSGKEIEAITTFTPGTPGEKKVKVCRKEK